MDREPELSPDERKRVREWLRERDDLRAQGRLVLAVGLAVAGFLGWLGFDHVVEIVRRIRQ